MKKPIIYVTIENNYEMNGEDLADLADRRRAVIPVVDLNILSDGIYLYPPDINDVSSILHLLSETLEAGTFQVDVSLGYIWIMEGCDIEAISLTPTVSL